MREDTPFRLASVTKPFTAAAALRLMAKGRLQPTQAVTEWLPWFTPRMADGSSPRITVGDLLGHRAALDYGFQQPNNGSYTQADVSDGLDESAWSLDENLRRLANVRLDRPPSQSWRYSLATDVLGAVVQRVAGISLEDAIRMLVLEPLGIDGAGFHTDRDDLAVPYAPDKAQPRRMTGPTEVVLSPGVVRFDPSRIHRKEAFASGGGGMYGSAPQVLGLLEALRSGTFLPEELRRNALAPHSGADAMAQGPGWGFSWLGAVLVDPALAQTELGVGTQSWGGVYGHVWFIDPSQQRNSPLSTILA